MNRHPSEAELALLAGGDCGWFRRFSLQRHIGHCGDCRDVLASFAELRGVLRKVPAPEMDWARAAAEMQANIRVGVAAGECVRERAPTDSHWGWKPQLAIGMASVLLLAGAGLFLRGLLPHDILPAVAHSAVLESTGEGVEVRTDSGSSMTLMNHGDAAADQTVTSQGAIRARYVDGNTGTVTVTSVYVE